MVDVLVRMRMCVLACVVVLRVDMLVLVIAAFVLVVVAVVIGDVARVAMLVGVDVKHADEQEHGQ